MDTVTAFDILELEHPLFRYFKFEQSAFRYDSRYSAYLQHSTSQHVSRYSIYCNIPYSIFNILAWHLVGKDGSRHSIIGTKKNTDTPREVRGWE